MRAFGLVPDGDRVDTYSLWVFAHILLFVYWLGADAGLYLVMVFVKNGTLSFETRATLIRLAFYIDLFPRICFALILPVGMHLVRDLGLYPIGNGLMVLGWASGILWSALHLGMVKFRNTGTSTVLARINRYYEGIGGLFFVLLGASALASEEPTIGTAWLAWKLLLFGLVFWVILGFDTMFRPFTTIMRMGPDGSTPEMEEKINRTVNRTMAWSILLYLLIAAIAFLGTVKPSW